MKMNLDKIEKLYTDNIEKYGIDSKSVGWKDKDSQMLRFMKLIEVADNSNEAITVNELGCGYGEMFKHMLSQGFKVRKYMGYDISEKMLDAAKTYINDPRAEYIKSNVITKTADYSLTSGIFNVSFDIGGDREWEEYIIHVIQNMNEHSTKGFSFNLLSTYVDFKEDHLYYGNPLYFFDYCKRHISKFVNLLHDYKLYEWTILVRK